MRDRNGSRLTESACKTDLKVCNESRRRDARAIAGRLVDSEAGTEVLREFRDYFRAGAEISLRGPERVERHGSESYFVLGEGLLTESVGGRERTLAATAEAQAPPFRFSRMGPNGTGRQLGDGLRKKLAAAMTAGRDRASRIPAGFTLWGAKTRFGIFEVVLSFGTPQAPKPTQSQTARAARERQEEASDPPNRSSPWSPTREVVPWPSRH